MRILGKELREIRESKNILLIQVTSYLEIDTAMISKMERGEKNLTEFKLLKLRNIIMFRKKI